MNYLEGQENTLENVQKDPIVGKGGLVASGLYRDIPGNTIPDYISGKTSQEATIAAIKGTPLYDASKGPQIDVGNGPRALNPTTDTFNAPGQGFTTPEAQNNELIAVRANLAKITETANKYLATKSTTLPADTVPTRDNPTGAGTPPTTGTGEIPGSSSDFAAVSKQLSSILSGQTPATPAQDPAAQLAGFQNSAGFTGAQNDLNSAKTDLANFEQSLLADQDKVKSTPGVSSTYINRQLVKLDADTAEQYRAKQAAVSAATDRLQSATTAVNQLMQLNNQNYTNSRESYEFEVNKALQIQTLVSNNQDKQADNARANITALYNAIKDKPAAFANPTPEQKAQWNNLEVQAGWQPGTLEAYANALPGTNILFHNTDNGVTSIFYEDPNHPGQVGQVKTYGTASGGTTLTPAQKAQMTGLADNELKKGLDAKTGYINGADYVRLRSDWSAYQDPLSFDSNFSYLLSPEDKTKYGVK